MNIPYGKQFIDDDDIEAVTKVLRSPHLTQGPKVLEFEKKIAQYCQAQYAIAFSSGTAALHAACHVLDLKEGDEGIVPPITFAATANSLLYCKTKPVFTDTTPGMPLLDPLKVKECISPQTKVILPVHFSGSVCDMESIYQLAKKNNIAIIEDACHALGSEYLDSTNKRIKVGSCTHSEMTIFSFHPVKPITTGEGGMITTNDKTLYNHLIIFRQHGIKRDADPNRGWYYEMQGLGYNYRMPDINATLGISQLDKLPLFLKKRSEIFERYKAFLDKTLTLLSPPPQSFSTHHLIVTLSKSEEDRNNLYNKLKGEGILAQVHYIPVYKHPYYQKLGYKEGICPLAEDYFKKALSIPVFHSLTEEEQNYIVKCIKKYAK